MNRLIQVKNTYLILVTELFIFLFLSSISVTANGDFKNSRFVSEGNFLNFNDSLKIVPAADLMNTYLYLLEGKKIAVVANQTSIVGKGSLQNKQSYTHLIDTLLSHNVNIIKVFAPEHGFRGKVDAGETVSDDKDMKTGLPIISLYGSNKKPKEGQLKDIDLVLFDIQDVGVRFYTYISTMSLVMEACAEQNIPILVLDRPNPNGHYIDGPVLKSEFSSFLGMHEVPLVYGMTIGEYAKMVNGEGWLKNEVQCDLKVIPVLNYTHKSFYSLPVRPSPNLPNDNAISLYPSLGFFEGTIINAGRGTDQQIPRYGDPFFPETEFSYTPQSNFGAKHPKFKGQRCFGVDLDAHKRMDLVNLEWLIDAYKKTPKEESFFGKTFTAHAGNGSIQKQIEAGKNANEIRATWSDDLEKFKKIRSNYLLYP